MSKSLFKSNDPEKVPPFYITMLGGGLVLFSSMLIYVRYMLLPENGGKMVNLFGVNLVFESKISMEK